MEYKGFEVVQFIDDAEMVAFYENPAENIFQLRCNEYAILKDSSGKIVDKVRWDGGKYTPLSFKRFKNEHSGKIAPKNTEQELAFDMLQNPHLGVRLLTGRWGSGKTMLMVTHALNMVLRGGADRLVWIRNNYVTKDSNDIGYLPGSFIDKMIVWAAPLIDHLGGEEGLRNAMDDGQVEIQHLGFIRGRDIKNSIVLCSEAENLTAAHAALLLSRIGEGSQLWLDGDTAQTDHKKFERDSGIEAIVRSLAGNPLFGYVELQKTERSAVAELASIIQ